MDPVEAVMEKICELCCWPYFETDQEHMDDRCAACTIEAEIRKLAKGGSNQTDTACPLFRKEATP